MALSCRRAGYGMLRHCACLPPPEKRGRWLADRAVPPQPPHRCPLVQSDRRKFELKLASLPPPLPPPTQPSAGLYAPTCPPIRPLVAPAASLDIGRRVKAQADAVFAFTSRAEGATIGQACCSRWFAQGPKATLRGDVILRRRPLLRSLPQFARTDAVRHAAQTN
ncbi:hypothetical protein L1887_62728 [Cichorium endivia]|nr:hypothetical protein L1887_62728 [Cichorium endivia]